MRPYAAALHLAFLAALLAPLYAAMSLLGLAAGSQWLAVLGYAGASVSSAASTLLLAAAARGAASLDYGGLECSEPPPPLPDPGLAVLPALAPPVAAAVVLEYASRWVEWRKWSLSCTASEVEAPSGEVPLVLVILAVLLVGLPALVAWAARLVHPEAISIGESESLE